MRKPDLEILRELLARAMAAQGPDAVLNAALDCCFIFQDLRPARADDFEGKFGFRPGSIRTTHGFLTSHNRTGSIDEALELVERALPGAWWILGKGRTRVTEPLYGARLLFGSDTVLGEAEHDANPALAIILALLRAVIAATDQ